MPLPEAPKYPCPYLSQEEITKYLAPLYDQGWRIGSSHFTLQKHVAPSAQEAPELAKAFLFLPEREEAWIAFIEEVAKIQSQEDHHCTLLIDGACVHVRTHTHSARPLVDENAKPGNALDRPGITLRDVRLATLIEEAFRPFLTAGAARWRTQLLNNRHAVRPLTPKGIEHLRYLGGKKKYRPVCPVCGLGTHQGKDCPRKNEVAPPSACRKCGQMHWTFLCTA
ncbi:hypothetical protein C8Q72DRAFT_794696 [Fomitopsis betulina]|nr:hypothetical protein C8Q72DRAFT_794696 [Fomitopsis betulina]